MRPLHRRLIVVLGALAPAACVWWAAGRDIARHCRENWTRPDPCVVPADWYVVSTLAAGLVGALLTWLILYGYLWASRRRKRAI